MAVTTIARRVLATGAIAGTALLALTIPASAHTNRISSDCTDKGSYLKVDLNSYNGGVTNTVQVTVDGKSQADETFKSNWENKWDLDNTVEHSYTVTVKAGDDQDGSKGFSFSTPGTIKACVEAPPTTTTTTTVAPTSSTTTSETPAPTTSPAATPPADQGGLANTGASVGLPLGIGALLLVGGGALLLVVRKRRSAA